MLAAGAGTEVTAVAPHQPFPDLLPRSRRGPGTRRPDPHRAGGHASTRSADKRLLYGRLDRTRGVRRTRPGTKAKDGYADHTSHRGAQLVERHSRRDHARTG